MISRKLKYLNVIILVLILIPSLTSFAFGQHSEPGHEIKTDQSKVKVLTVPDQKIEKFKKDSDFNYYVKKEEGTGLWDIIRRWLYDLIEELFSNRGAAPFFRYVLISLLVAFIIYKIVGGNLSGIFNLNKKAKGTNGFDYFEEDIHQHDIDKKLNDAIRNKNFRDAIRYYYLILLKKLDTGEFIQWELGKTNRDYQKELKNKPFLEDFINLSGIYEYSWYGNFDVKEEKFVKWQSGFNSFYEILDN